MKRYTTRLLGGTLLALSASACSDFLTGEGIDTDPNNPTEATTNQLFVAAQAALMALQEGPVAQFSCLVIQHCGGVGNYVETWGATYEITSDDFNADFLQVYVGGGLLDLRIIQERTETDNRPYAGMAKVMEALQVSFAADNFGDIPYSESVGENLEPKFDNQLDVYAALQTLLDEAIADLGASGSGPNPSGVDLFYGGDTDLWIEAAYTLKARLYLHMVEAYRTDPNVTNPLANAAQVQTLYGNAITAANNGISSRANDFRSPHTSATSERNLWFQFSLSTFGQYLKAGQPLIDIMSQASRAGDRRLTGLPAERYFSDANPNTAGDQFAGVDLQADIPSIVSEVGTSTGATRITDSYRQPLLTYDENELILAEAYVQTGQAGTALIHLNNVRTFYGAPALGAATLQDVAEEQYVTYFQNIEAWQSYKRHCYPNLENAPETSEIPGRLFYGTTEEVTNPNTPSTAEQGTRGGAANDQPAAYAGRNRNDPPGGFVVPAASCLGLTAN